MSSKSKADKSTTPKKFENRARTAMAIASYADEQDTTHSNKKSISEEARQKVARIFDVFDGKWKKEDILRSLEEHDFDEQATILAKTEGKDEWKDVPSKRRVEPKKTFKKQSADTTEDGADGENTTNSNNRGRGGFRGGRGRGGFRGGRGGRGGFRGGKTSYADRAKHDNHYHEEQAQPQQAQQQEAPAAVIPAKPLYSEIAKKRKELDEQAAAEKQKEQQQATIVPQEEPQAVQPEPVQVNNKKQRKQKKAQEQQQQQPTEEVAAPQQQQAPQKQKKLRAKYVAAQQQPATSVVVNEVQDTQQQQPTQQPEEEEVNEPEVVLPNTQYNNIDLKFGAFADGDAPVEQPSAPALTTPAPTQQQQQPAQPQQPSTQQDAPATTTPYYGSWNQQPSHQAENNYFYDDKQEAPQQGEAHAPPQTGKQAQPSQPFKVYPQQNFLPQQYHQYGYPYHPYMMNFQYQGGYPNPSKPYPYYAQKNMYAYPTYGNQPSTNAANQGGYPYPEAEAAAHGDYGKYQSVPFYGVPQHQPYHQYDQSAPTSSKPSRGGPQQAQQQAPPQGKDKRGQPTDESAAYNNYMHHYGTAYMYAPTPYQQYPPQQHVRSSAPQQQGKGDWNPAYNQAQ